MIHAYVEDQARPLIFVRAYRAHDLPHDPNRLMLNLLGKCFQHSDS